MKNNKQKYHHLVKIFSLIVFVLLFFSCASGRSARIDAPGWFLALSEYSEGDCYYFPVSSEAVSPEAVADAVGDMVFAKLLEVSGLEELFSRREDRDVLVEQIKSLFYPVEQEASREQAGTLPLSLDKSEWLNESGYTAFFGYFCIKADAAEKLQETLAERYFGDDKVLNALLDDSRSAEESGLHYQSAEALLQAAVYVLDSDNPLSLSLADKYVLRAAKLLKKIEISIDRYPDKVEANSKVETPFSLRCMEGIIGIRDVEFLVRYRGKKRDGSIGTFEVRIVSDVDGYVSFYHPFLPFAGESELVMKPGSRDIRTNLRQLEEKLKSALDLRAYLDDQTVTLPFTVLSSARAVPTGIVVLHTDVTGADLDFSETATGLKEVLEEDGFDTEIMNLSPLEITSSNEASFLRDLKAVYSGQYTRVIFGVVGINNFEMGNDLYKVETSGVLKVVDVKTGEILMVSEMRKSVESRDNALAIAASFRELGKAFALEMKDNLY